VTSFADLHIHSHFSDSTLSPRDIVRLALEAHLAAVAITDHDTTDAIPEARLAAEGLPLEVIAGVELSAEIHEKDVHMLGYFLDCDNAVLKKELEKMRHVRLERIEAMVKKLETQGIDNLQAQEVFDLAKSDAVGRMHLATALKQKGAVSSISEAFEKYIGEDCPAYVKKFKISPYDAIALIRQAGGVAVLAHPMVTGKDELLPSLVEAGLGGMEVYYPNCSQAIVHFYEGLARKYRLVATGGSDAHGEAKTNTFIGKVRLPYEKVEELKAAIKH